MKSQKKQTMFAKKKKHFENNVQNERKSSTKNLSTLEDGRKLEVGDTLQLVVTYLKNKYLSMYGLISLELWDDTVSMDEDILDLPKLEEMCGDPDNPTAGEQIKYQAEYNRVSKKNEKTEELIRINEQKRSEIIGAFLLECSSELQEKIEERDPQVRMHTDLYEFKELVRTAMETNLHIINVHEIREDLEKELRGIRMMRDETIFQFKKRILTFAAKNNQAVEENKHNPDSRLLPTNESQLAKHFMDHLDKTRYGSKMDDMKSAIAMRSIQYPDTLDMAVLVVQSWVPTTYVQPKGIDDKVVFTALSGNKMTFQKQQNGQYQQINNKENKIQNGQTEKLNKDKKVKDKSPKSCYVCSQEGHNLKTCPIVLKAMKDMEPKSDKAVVEQVEKNRLPAVSAEKKNVSFTAMSKGKDLHDDDDDDSDQWTFVSFQEMICSPANMRTAFAATKGLRKLMKSGTITGLDSMSTSNIIRSSSLVVHGSTKTCAAEVVQSLAGETKINLKGEFIFTGKSGKSIPVAVNPRSICNILCQDDILKEFHHDVVMEYDEKGDKVFAGFDIQYIPGIITKYRSFGKLLLGDMADVLNMHEFTFSAVSEPTNGIKSLEVVSLNNFKKAAMVNRVVDRIMMNTRSLALCVKSGYMTNTGFSEHDIRRADQLSEIFDLAKSGEFVKAQMKIKAKASLGLTDDLVSTEVVAVADLVFDSTRTYLGVVTMPGSHLWLSRIGDQKYEATKSVDAVRPHVDKYLQFAKSRGFKVKKMASDSERSIWSMKEEIESHGIEVIQYEKGHHDGTFNNIIRNFKEKVRFLEMKWPLKRIDEIIDGQIMAAAMMYNISPTKTNLNAAPPSFIASGGIPTDYSKVFSKCGSMDFVCANTETDTNRNSTAISRAIEGVALYPVNRTGSWKVLDIETGNVVVRSDIVRCAVHRDAASKIDVIYQKENERISKKELTLKHREERMTKQTQRNQERQLKSHTTPSKGRVTKTQVEERIKPGHKPAVAHEMAGIPSRNLAQDFNFSIQMSYSCGYEKHQDEAKRVMIKELAGIDDRSTWIPVMQRDMSHAQKLKIVQGIAIIAEKYQIAEDKLETILKGRLCADGRREDVSMFLEGELAAPTVQILSLFTMMSIAATKNYHVMTFDIGQAFLNAKIENEVYVRLDKRLSDLLISINPSYKPYQSEHGTLVMRLLKALYGTKEAAKLWYNHFSGILIEYGYRKSELDKCVFHKDEEDKQRSTCMIHVDDGIVLSSDPTILAILYSKLNNTFEGKFTYSIGKVHRYLGMQIFITDGNVLFTMTEYIKDICEEYEVTGTKRVPADPDLFSIDKTLKVLDEVIRKKYHSGVAKVLFLATRIRYDILCATIFLSRRVKVATSQDWNKFINVLRYLNRTSHLGLNLGGNKRNLVELKVYADAAHAVNDNMASQTGNCISLGRGTIYAKSKDQKARAVSSYEAEMYSLSDVIPPAVWIQDFLNDAGYGDDISDSTVYEDNMSVIHSIRSGETSSDRTRHIRIRKLFTKDFIESGRFKLEYCKSNEMIADILTKPLQGELFEKLRDLLLGYTINEKEN